MSGSVDEKVADSKRTSAPQNAVQEVEDTMGNHAGVRGGARLRVEPPESTSAGLRFPIAFSALGSQVWSWVKQHGAALLASKPYTDRPASIQDVVKHTLAGGWVPGEQVWWKELPGYIYGFALSVPLTAIGFAVIWVGQRRLRVFAVALIIAFLKWGV
jgi:hypothetical protein